MSKTLIVIAHNIRSAHNIGSLMRTSEGLGIEKFYITGYSPYPKQANDERLPHISTKIENRIQKTALDAQATLNWEYVGDVTAVINSLKQDGYIVAALEQTKDSQQLHQFDCPQKLAILIGSEVTGISDELLKITDFRLEIPMAGSKESFNVVEATTMALYQCRFHSS